MAKKAKKAKKDFDLGVPPGLAKQDVAIQFTDDNNVNVFVAHNDMVWVNGNVEPKAVVVHDVVNGVEITRVDINGDGVFEINPPEEITE